MSHPDYTNRYEPDYKKCILCWPPLVSEQFFCWKKQRTNVKNCVFMGKSQTKKPLCSPIFLILRGDTYAKL